MSAGSAPPIESLLQTVMYQPIAIDMGLCGLCQDWGEAELTIFFCCTILLLWVAAAVADSRSFKLGH